VRGCCSGPACGEFFTERVAQRDARAYRRKGLTGPAARIRDVLSRCGLEGSTVLEVGGGVGALHLELLQAGAATATNVELSPAYEPYAAGLAREAGLEARVQRRLLDFAREAEVLAPADLVVLNKVVCCYPDYESLVGAAADRTRRLLVMSFPRDSWWTRTGIGAVNLVQRLRRNPFRAYVHPPAEIVAVAGRHGLRPVLEERGRIWQLAAVERTRS
jgi:SAM-dependent methyltransferase